MPENGGGNGHFFIVTFYRDTEFVYPLYLHVLASNEHTGII